MNQIQISLPLDPRSHIDLIIQALNEKLKIENMVLLEGKNNALVMFRCQNTKVPRVLEVLNEIGVGIEFGMIDILNLKVSIPELKDEKMDISEELTSRVSVEEIESTIKEGMELNINYYIFIIIAAFIAGAGLILNSTAIIIGAMIISPLMGPILGVSYGTISKNYSLVKKGLLGQFFGILLAIGIGALLALLAINLYGSTPLTQEMINRSFPTVFDLIVSIGAGLALGFAITGRVQTSLVGIAIAVSLMPPAVNIGIALIYGNDLLSLGSFILLMSNILAINLSALLVFKIKKFKILEEDYPFWKGPEEKVIKLGFGVNFINEES